LAIVFALQAVRTWVEFEGKDRRERLERRRSSGRQTNIDGEVRRLEGSQSQVSLNSAASQRGGIKRQPDRQKRKNPAREEVRRVLETD
jgi:hypothetical protein